MNRKFRKIICKFDGGMEAIYMRNKLMEILFTVFPDDKDIIYISPPYLYGGDMVEID